MEQRYQTLKELTKDFTLTYTEIKNRVEVKSGSLSDLSQKEITNIIRRERQNLKRKRRHNP